MTVMISVDINFDPADVRHKHHPADSKCHAYGVLKIGNATAASATLYFGGTADIDAVIAELVALKQEMDPPVITDSERTCDQANPDTGAWCHKSYKHVTHRDTDGGTWTTAADEPASPDVAAVLDAAITAGTPVLVADDEAECAADDGRSYSYAPGSWCPGTTFMEHEEVTLYCDRIAGHAGSHHAPGPDEGSEVAWSDEPASVTA